MARPAAQQEKRREDDVMSPYQIAQEWLDAQKIRQELDAEKRRSFAPFALEPMTTDTWHQPEKRLQSDVPFTCGGEL